MTASNDDPSRPVAVKVIHGNAVGRQRFSGTILQIHVKSDGTDSILDVKKKIAEAAGGSLKAQDLFLSFGPNDRKMGCQFRGDPTVDESKLLLSQFSVLQWLDRFPHWTLSVRLVPDAPPPPGACPTREEWCYSLFFVCFFVTCMAVRILFSWEGIS